VLVYDSKAYVVGNNYIPRAKLQKRELSEEEYKLVESAKSNDK
jgi:hypothetical protein